MVKLAQVLSVFHQSFAVVWAVLQRLLEMINAGISLELKHFCVDIGHRFVDFLVEFLL